MSLPSLLTTLALLALLAAAWVLAGLAWQDLTRRRLPNPMVGAYAALFVPYALGSEMDWATLGWHVGLGLGTVVLMAFLFSLKIMGGGDVKLWGALMLWTGPQGAIIAIVIATLTGGLLGVLGLIAKQILKRRRRPVGRPVLKTLSASRGIPYGTGLALAGIHHIWTAIL